MPTNLPIGAKEGMAWALAAIAGFIDDAGYLTLHHLFTAHMSGNSARLGVFLGKVEPGAAVPLISAVLLFVGGIGVATAVAEIASRRGARSTMPLLLGIQALLLAVFMAYGATVVGPGGQVAEQSGNGFYLLAALLIVAIGFQVCALQHAGSQRARTTYVSGMLTRFAQEAVNWLFWLHDGATRPAGTHLGGIVDGGERAQSAARMLLFGGIWCAYIGGAVAGTWLHAMWRVWAMACPLALLLVLVGIDRWRPFKP